MKIEIFQNFKVPLVSCSKIVILGSDFVFPLYYPLFLVLDLNFQNNLISKKSSNKVQPKADYTFSGEIFRGGG